MSTQIMVGDIIEIPVKGGFAYAQYILKHEGYGYLISVFPQIRKEPLENFSELSEDIKHYATFFPIESVVKQKIFNVVSNLPIPEYAKDFPLFKTGIKNKEGVIETWWLWDGEKEWKVGKLTDKQKSLPDRGIWNHTLLIERIEEGWSPEIQ